ncbi:hypothetical protein N8I77_005499 [Diaporthe amygdali]|uniref:Transmembrane protein n=1 Tax=Phomopsis amygdali TaxID=1214568 RepID=A0AAD9SFU7_PHOAM|nr:hypothetical protein N8I77_005499 [Diaporthe amygdali]KAK2606769.1 hypothetical protein N8I77_005499 [Diaporthe amygdali]
MQYPSPLRRIGIVPGVLRLTALVLEILSFILLWLRHEPGYDWTTSYVILVYLILIDLLEIVCLCGQARGWVISALPILIGGDAIGALILVCSRDWYGLWYWHGPWYAMQHKLGSGLFFALPILRFILLMLAVFEYKYETRQDRLLAAEREGLLPR